ncbi:hypothetical protein ALPO108162_11180 [Alicyclobacillus pomorum]
MIVQNQENLTKGDRKVAFLFHFTKSHTITIMSSS